LAVAGFLGIAFSPVLLVEAPLLLIALSPLYRHLVVVAPMVDAPSFFVVAIVRLFAADPFMYALGKRYGRTALGWVEARSPFMGRFLRIVERIFARAGAFVFLASQALTVCTVAGVFRMPKGKFVAANLGGTLLHVTVAWYLGDALRLWVVRFQAWVDAHVVPLTAVTVAAALVGWLVWRRGAARRLAALRASDGDGS
jgi:membrane protein DedA with SNARE-associated domain